MICRIRHFLPPDFHYIHFHGVTEVVDSQYCWRWRRDHLQAQCSSSPSVCWVYELAGICISLDALLNIIAVGALLLWNGINGFSDAITTSNSDCDSICWRNCASLQSPFSPFTRNGDVSVFISLKLSQMLGIAMCMCSITEDDSNLAIADAVMDGNGNGNETAAIAAAIVSQMQSMATHVHSPTRTH